MAVNSKRSIPVVVSIGVILLAIAIWYVFSEGTELSQRGYELSMALANACNLQRTESIEKIEELIGESIVAGEISEAEKTKLERIVLIAKSGDWSTADSKVRTLMKQQAKRNR